MLSEITKLTHRRTRLFTAENVFGDVGRGAMAEVSDVPQDDVTRIGQKWDGANGCARELGRTYKVRPCITLPASGANGDTDAGSVTTIMDYTGSGRITHIWITMDCKAWRDIIIRMYWDGEATPSVEAPIGDFFCMGWLKPIAITSVPINVNPTGGMNCYFPMPFRKSARITIENRLPKELGGFFYAISMAEDEVSGDEAYFHAQFRRVNPTKYGEDYVIADGISGHGHYVGTQLAWQQNSAGWWGEGEVKAFIDGDTAFPTYCGTGTEDYFGGAWGFVGNFSAPFLGYQDVSTLKPELRETNSLGNRHTMYRFHVADPIYFEKDLKVTIQLLGWRAEGRYLPLMDDLASVAYWYQADPHGAFPKLGGRNALEII